MQREMAALESIFELWAVGSTAPDHPSVHFLPSLGLTPSRWERRGDRWYRRFHQGRPWPGLFPSIRQRLMTYLAAARPHIVIAHEPEMLPYLNNLKCDLGFKLVYNAHEYHPLEFEDDPKWMAIHGRHYHEIYKKELPQLDLLINVCQGIADQCFKKFSCPSLVVPNACAHRKDLAPQPVDPNFLRLVHHGAAIRGRELESMIEVVGRLGHPYHLDLMLVPNSPGYLDELKLHAAPYANIRFVTPVSFSQIVSFLNSYDIGLYLLSPKNFNQSMALPNKIFEFIQARLCLAISPNPEMRALATQHQLGVVAQDYSVDAMIKALRSLTPDQITAYKERSDQKASLLCAEHYQKEVAATLCQLADLSTA